MAGEQNNNVILNVYELMDTSGGGGGDQRPAYASITSFFSKLLPSTGFGAYHTSLDVDGFCYSFAAGGVSKIPVANKHKYIPSHATFKESIVLGSVVTTTDKNNNTSSTVQKFLDILKENFFTSTGYHLACRNCNHFTETFATALIVPIEDLLKKNPPALKSYPTWCNRLARTGATILDKKSDKAVTGTSTTSNSEDNNNTNKPSYCDVIKEARAAVGIIDYDDDKKMAALSASISDNNKRRKQKKELSEKQKQILAKLKKNKS
ncbi:hypothetical protein FRACYDRAFT_246449 [Fragilariopsis cylindrus CCMP1102]|uniref:PPPDE domain-containing protein n=1 Tax=Fragilariopsis cylindrus CCMP1102 TaxID=635003 RepID=A0A1E7EXY4_9STRA|nr:hypothetical protein FRACYDRAFT_246449 [Fragilariopsis cylindrus CCMP1102]|eukprot:OEU10696.1 hypothetical protein FRACYDRAFT_246449 [Fragilariopsis cylindrus CCMP1102]